MDKPKHYHEKHVVEIADALDVFASEKRHKGEGVDMLEIATLAYNVTWHLIHREEEANEQL